MANRRTNKKAMEKKKLIEQGYRECKSCGKLIKPRSFRCSYCSKYTPVGKQVVAISVVIVLLLASAGFFFFNPNSHEAYLNTAPIITQVYPSGLDVLLDESIRITFDKDMNKTSVESAFSITPVVQGTFTWSGLTMIYSPAQGLQYGNTYTVTIMSSASDAYGNILDGGEYSWQFTTEEEPVIRRDIGAGDDDFWFTYPDQHILTGTSATHPAWVSSDVQSKVVLILTHSEGCAPCVTQTAICESIYATYSPDLIYYDLLSGTDEPQASDTFAAYDPTGEANFIPLTILLTQGPDGQIIWHSWEGVVEEPILSDWIEDALSYHGDS